MATDRNFVLTEEQIRQVCEDYLRCPPILNLSKLWINGIPVVKITLPIEESDD